MLLARITKFMLNIGCLITLGTLGFCLLENWPIADSIYMTIITISTVGYGEMGELSSTGRAFTSILIFLSIVCMACWTANVTSVVVDGDISGRFREKRMLSMARKLKNHVIICGSGVYAQSILDMLYGGRSDLAVLSDDAEQMDLIRQKYPDIPLLVLPPTDELSLARANLANASYVVVATPSDIDNLLISMTCKQLNRKLFVCAYCLDGKLASRLDKLGVNEVICPHMLGGNRVVQLMEKYEKRKLPAPLLAESLSFIGSGV